VIYTCGTAATAAQGFGWYLPASVSAATGPVSVQGSSGKCLGADDPSGLDQVDGLGPTAACDADADWTIAATGAIETDGECLTEYPVFTVDGETHLTPAEFTLNGTDCTNDTSPINIIYQSDGILRSEVDGNSVAAPGPYTWGASDFVHFTLP
jgi:hypothetical protein